MKKKNYYKCLKRNKPLGVFPYKRLLGMCRWMGSHFHDWIDYNGVAFSMELLEWALTFSDFWGKKVQSSYLRLANVPERLYCRRKVTYFSFTSKKWVSLF